MGIDLERHDFSDAEYAGFGERLHDSLVALGRLLQRPGFGTGPATVGAELEVCLVDAAGRPSPSNAAVLADSGVPSLQLECDRFNLEIATTPIALAGRPFTALGREVERSLAGMRAAARRHGARVAVIGILPTLRMSDLLPEALTQTHRYQALSAGLRRLRHAPFEVDIEGADRLRLACDDVTLEGATTSWQIHLKVEPAAFVRTYNAAQIATAPALAASVNSPTFLGHRLWDETRIALFRQAVDDRAGATADDWRPARVSFGHGWLRESALEPFTESVTLHPPLVAEVDAEDPIAVEARGDVPRLRELRLHQGTVWRWNRAVYDPDGGGHVRIELRALPAGPTVVDMLANTAFLLGLTMALAPESERLVSALTFGQARRNFYEAARAGLDAEILWPSEPPSPRPIAARALLPRLVPLARAGLGAGGVAADEAERLLDVFASRVERGRTGAWWQRAALAALERDRPRDEALRLMLDRYLGWQDSPTPVHEWPVPS